MRTKSIKGRAYTLMAPAARLSRVGGEAGANLSDLVARMRVARLKRQTLAAAKRVKVRS